MIADFALAVVFIVGFASIGITALIVGCYAIDQAWDSWRKRVELRERIAIALANETVEQAQARARAEARRDAEIAAARKRHPS